MMSFYPGSFCAPAPELSFTPLFSLLSDLDNYSREVQRPQPSSRRQVHRQPQRRPAFTPTFNPRFDVRETEIAYELHGELPGLERENVNIEFTEPQTLLIRGRVERNYGVESPESNSTTAEEKEEIESSPTSDPTTTETATKVASEPTNPEKTPSRRSSYQATVEDDPEDENYTPSSTPATSPKTEAAKPVTPQPEEQKQVTKPAPATTSAPATTQQQPRYFRRWERSVGEFSRTFTFPSRVDYDGVSARLDNGILTVSVPKARALVARRIVIF